MLSFQFGLFSDYWCMFFDMEAKIPWMRDSDESDPNETSPKLKPTNYFFQMSRKQLWKWRWDQIMETYHELLGCCGRQHNENSKDKTVTNVNHKCCYSELILNAPDLRLKNRVFWNDNE